MMFTLKKVDQEWWRVDIHQWILSICNLREHNPQRKPNNRAKCLIISQVVRAKLYNSCLLFIYKSFYYYYVILLLILFHISFPIYSPSHSLAIWAHHCLGSRTQLVTCTSSLLSFTSAKLLTYLAIRKLLNLLLVCALMTNVDQEQWQLLNTI